MAACVFFDFVKGRACAWVPHMHAACASFPATFLWVSENLKSLLWALALCIRLLLAGLLLLLYSSLPCWYEAARGQALFGCASFLVRTLSEKRILHA